jgi:16S rRNA (guanine966-N2)-methyltransferase
MRIVAGRLKGLNFVAPKGFKTHPMSDKVRGGLFNTLGDIKGLTILDVYSGSGALSFEAVSRGAKHAISIEADVAAHKVITQNVSTLGVEGEVKATRAYIKSWLNRVSSKMEAFDIITADPPYNEAQQNLNTIDRFERVLKVGGILVLSWPGNLDIPDIKGVNIVKINNYGDAQLVFYKKLG